MNCNIVGDVMLNIIWPIFIIVSFVYAISMGNVDSLNNSIFSSTQEAINLAITLLGTMSLWSGIMKIASKTSLIQNFTKIVNPVINILFPEIKEDIQIKNAISMNIIANILGLGNAATPLGLRAMKLMQEKNLNKKTLTNSMAILIVLNTASIQIIPTTVIAIRSLLGSENPTKIIFPVWIATVCSSVTAILATKFFIKIGK